VTRAADGQRTARRVVNWCAGDTKSDRQQVHGCDGDQPQCMSLLSTNDVTICSCLTGRTVRTRAYTNGWLTSFALQIAAGNYSNPSLVTSLKAVS